MPASCVKRVTRSSSSVFGPRTAPKYNASVPWTLSSAVTIGVDGETVTVNDATVTAVDIPASNGIIHVIDSVLLPPAA